LTLKVIDRLFLKGIAAPYILSFFIVEFVLLMSFLWKNIDDLLGKGYNISDFAELIFYFAVGIIPLALPLTILLSTLMVYGEMAEKHELSAFKSSGTSLLRMLMPSMIVALMTMGLSILASNVLKPEASKKYHNKFRAMKTNQLTFAFDEKVFNQEFNLYSIWIDKKEDDGRTISGIRIYNHSDPSKSVIDMIYAKRGEMYSTDDQKYLIMELYDGYLFKEIRGEAAIQDDKGFNKMGRPVNRVTFKKMRKSFDLSEMLNLNMTQSNYRQYDMMNSIELLAVIDSLDQFIYQTSLNSMYDFNDLTIDRSIPYLDEFKTDIPTAVDTTINVTQSLIDLSKRRVVTPLPIVKPLPLVKKGIKRIAVDLIEPFNIDTLSRLISIVKAEHYYDVVQKALTNSQAIRDRAFNKGNEIKMKHEESKRYIHRLNQQYSSALVCLIFLFIGVPAGAIVRKGGFGLPLLIAILFYMTFIMSGIFGEKLMKSGAISPILSAWLPCVILLPFAIVLTYLALNDRNITGFSIKENFLLLKDKMSKKTILQ
jgi:lipopolysaccharide export system permease protein